MCEVHKGMRTRVGEKMPIEPLPAKPPSGTSAIFRNPTTSCTGDASRMARIAIRATAHKAARTEMLAQCTIPARPETVTAPLTIWHADSVSAWRYEAAPLIEPPKKSVAWPQKEDQRRPRPAVRA